MSPAAANPHLPGRASVFTNTKGPPNVRPIRIHPIQHRAPPQGPSRQDDDGHREARQPSHAVRQRVLVLLVSLLQFELFDPFQLVDAHLQLELFDPLQLVDAFLQFVRLLVEWFVLVRLIQLEQLWKWFAALQLLELLAIEQLLDLLAVEQLLELLAIELLDE